MTILTLVPRACVEASRSLIEHLIVNPLHGLAEIARGIALACPDIVRAASDAVVEAVKARLSDEAMAKVGRGGAQVVGGAKLLAAPVAVAIGVLVCLHPTVIYLGWAAWLVIIATAMAVG